MPAEEHPCPDCGTVLGKGFTLAGLCPHCLLELALEASPPPQDLGAGTEAPTVAYTEATLSPGQVLGNRYQVRSLLGRGGMGEVWRAFDLKLRVDVALKALRGHLLEDERALETLRQEVRTAREVVSPNVCRVFDLIEMEGQELVSMEYIDGTTLQEVLKTRSPLALDEAREIAAQFLAGLEAIHEAGLVHRDMKPENVMLTRSGRAVVMDFGIAKGLAEAGAGTVAGTPAYMAPEQARGEAVDARADVFSSGVLLAEMVAPEGVQDIEARQAVWRGVQHEPPDLADSPWRAVVTKAVSRLPEQRHAGAAALARALEEVTLRVAGAEDVQPYPGLAAFTADDAEYFFGRELEVEAMWKKLRRPHLLGLIGPSGAGKSSFLRAGLLPAMPEGWAALVCAPGNRPGPALAQALARELAGDLEAIEQLPNFDQPDVAVGLVHRWRQHHEHALVVVDQFEELFTQNPEEVQTAFAELLARLALEADVHVLLSMRDDFLYRCHAFQPLHPMLDGLTLLSPPTGAALRRAVVQPALKCGYRFEDDALVEEILAEVEHERGALPMLAFAAARLWEHRDRDEGVLTREAYEYTGGVGGALAQHAEATLERIGTDYLPLVRELFRNLVTAEGTRAARDRDELLSVFSELEHSPQPGAHSPQPDARKAAAVLDTLIDARLLTSYETGTDETAAHRIEIIHESLLTAWPRLIRWQTQDADSAQLRDQVRQAAQLWEGRGRPEDLLWTGTSFREYQLWRERYGGRLSAAEERFARAMSAKSLRRRRRRRLMLASGFVVLLVVLAVVGGFWQQAEHQALRAEASKLLALAEARLEKDPTEALALATASLELADAAEARSMVMRALWEAPPAFVLEAPPVISGVMRFPLFSPTGEWLVFSGNSPVAMAWPNDGEPPIELGGLEAMRRCANSGRWASEDLLVMGLCPPFHVAERVQLWSLPEGRLVREVELGGPTSWNADEGRLLGAVAEFGEGEEIVRHHLRSWRLPDGDPNDLGSVDWQALGAVDFSPDPSGDAWLYAKGRTLFARPLPIGSGPDRVIGSHPASIQGLALSAPRRLLSLDTEGESRWWELTPSGGSLLATAPKPEGGELLDLDPTGRFLYPFFDERLGKGLLWNLAAPAEARPLELRRSGSWAYASHDFHPSGEWVVATTRGHHEATFWPLRRPYPTVLEGAVSDRKPLAFSPDSSYLAALWPGQVRLLPLPLGEKREVLQSTLPNLTRLEFDSAGARLLRAGIGLSIEEVDGEGSIQLEGFLDDTLIEAAAFSPSGRSVAAASGWSDEERTLRIWDLETGETRAFDLPPAEDPEVTGLSDQVGDLWFVDEETLFTLGGWALLRWDLRSGTATGVSGYETGRMVAAAASADGRTAVIIGTADEGGDFCGTPRTYDSHADRFTARPAFGDCVSAVAIDAGGTVLASGDATGVVRVGRLDGGEPHLLTGHEGAVESVAVSPDLRWVASAGWDGTLRIWPMPDLSKPPLHTWPRDELLDKLRSLTNLRAVPDLDSSGGWTIEIGSFPGWAEVPTW